MFDVLKVLEITLYEVMSLKYTFTSLEKGVTKSRKSKAFVPLRMENFESVPNLITAPLYSPPVTVPYDLFEKYYKNI